MIEVERGEAQTGGSVIIITKFQYRYPAGPVILYIIVIDTEVLFNVLIGPFGLFIHFRIKDHRKISLNP